jgi:hypothetical protein
MDLCISAGQVWTACMLIVRPVQVHHLRRSVPAVRRLALLLVLAVAACSGDDNDGGFVADLTVPASSSPPETVTLTGEGEMSTDPFDLAGGDYKVAFDFQGSCYYSATMYEQDAEPGSIDGIPEEVGSGDGPVAGDTNAYRVESGSHYVRVITGPPPGCPWTITLTRR